MAPSFYDNQQHTIPTGSSYKRARPVVPDLPTSVAWLEHTSFEMTATVSKTGLAHCSTEYLMHVYYRTSASPHSKPQSWQVSRSFDDYVAFQHRLLKTLSYGHACSAECRWLHSFAKKYFPKKVLLFGNCSTTTMNQRREKLSRFMNVLKASLLNRGNHGCAIVINGLASEFAIFLEGHHRVENLIKDDEDERVRRCSMSSSISTSSTDAGDDHDEHHIGELDNVCDLCHCHLDSNASATDSSDSPCHLDGLACDTTTLSCGHQFHDACVLPQLEALNYCCPSCSEPQL